MKPRQTSLSSLAFASIIATLTAMPNAYAQPASASAPPTAAPTQPAYDVMTIKLNRSLSGSVSIHSGNGLYSATNVSLKGLLSGIYDIKQDLIFGISGPLESARFDIAAKIVDPDRDALDKMPQEQRRKMLLPLLAQRFQLKTHGETKTLPIFDLVVLPSGPKFKPSANQNSTDAGTDVHGTHTGSTLTAHDIPMSTLTKSLGDPAHRTVVDKTGLTGTYDLTLQWSNDDYPDASTEQAPSIFTALPEQLGLKLQPAKGPVETLIVDHAEMPTEN